MRQISSFSSVIIINDLIIKFVKAFPTTFQMCCLLTLLL